MSEGAGFLGPAEPTPEAEQLYAGDEGGLGYVMNLTRLWAHQPAAQPALRALLDEAAETGGLSFRQRGILITAAASILGDSYCSLAWGGKLAGEADPSIAAAVLTGTDEGLDGPEQALAAWARKVARDPNAIEATDVHELRRAGFGDRQIFGITLFVALRLAFSTTNDALGAGPDQQIADGAPAEVRAAVRFGRPVAD